MTMGPFGGITQKCGATRATRAMEKQMGRTLEQVEQWRYESARKELPLLDEVAKEQEALAREMFTPPIAFQTDNEIGRAHV